MARCPRVRACRSRCDGGPRLSAARRNAGAVPVPGPWPTIACGAWAGQVGGELPATEPYRRTLAVHVACPGHGVAGHLAGVALAEPLTDEEPGRFQPGEELMLAARTRRRRVDRTPQHGPGKLLPAAPLGVDQAASRCGRRLTSLIVAGPVWRVPRSPG